MTYSNRSSPSPWQHQTELNGEANNMVLFDKINPYVFGKFSLPGTWSDPYAYSQSQSQPIEEGPPPCAVEPSCDTSKSPICDVAIAAGDWTVGMCQPTEPNCPMKRKWVPERNINPGMWNYQQQQSTATTIANIIKELKSNSTPLVCMVVMIMVVVIIFKCKK